MLTRKRVAKVALENTMGTKVAGTQAVNIYDMDGPVSTAEYLRRAGTGLYTGNTVTGVHGAETGRASGRIPLIGTGSSGMGLAALIFLQAGWLVKSSETYQVSSNAANWKALSFDAWLDGKKKSLFGAMCNLVLNWERGRPEGAMLDFELQGIFSSVTDEALPAFSPEDRPPMRMTAFTINSVAKKIHSLSLDMQSEVVPRSDPNATQDETLQYIITDNSPQITIDPEDELVASYDFDGIRQGRTEHAIVATFSDGTDTVTVTLPKVQLTECPEGEREGLSTIQYVGQCNHSSGDDAVQIAVT